MSKASFSPALIGLIALSSMSHASLFNVNDAFLDNETPNGSEANPFGNYTYGYSLDTSDTTALSIANLVHTDLFAGYANLEGYFIDNNADVPAILGNTSGSNVTTTFATIAPGQLLLHPGGLGSNAFTAPFASAVLRYTTPAAGSYLISGEFFNLDTGQTDIHVLVNGVSFFNGIDAGAFSSSLLSLAAGAKIDFVVGSSTDNIGNDSTGLFANIAQVPEPATLALLALGLMGIGFSRRKQ